MTMGRLWSAQVAGEARPGLSTARIVEAAIELADAGGLEAVAMSRIAKRLGSGTMSLYRHVGGKDELLSLMVDEAVGEPTDPPGEGWRAGLEHWAYDLRGVVRRHPWLLDVQLARRPLGPRRAAWLDNALSALAGTPLDEGAKAAVALVVNGFVFSEARTAADVEPANDASPAIVAGLAEHLPADRHPALRRAVDAATFEDEPDPDAAFAFGLGIILDGIERRVDQDAQAKSR